MNNQVFNSIMCRDLIVKNIATPEAAADLVSSSAAGDLLSSFSLPTVPGITDSPWSVANFRMLSRLFIILGAREQV